MKKIHRQSGFSLIELMVTLAVAGILASVAVPAYQDSVERARAAEAAQRIGQISAEIERFYTNNFRYPNNLTELGLSGADRKDPWGKNYLYVDLSADGAKPRKANAAPINTDYDLLSRGKDGVSARNLSRPNAIDDIVRAGNGSFIGKPEDLL